MTAEPDALKLREMCEYALDPTVAEFEESRIIARALLSRLDAPGRDAVVEAEVDVGEYDCIKCFEKLRAQHPNGFITRRFIGCSECGNKRCPKSSDHTLQCTGSNEPGQPGSVY